jgi:hypothetical protein
MKSTIVFLIMFMAVLFVFAAVGRRHWSRKKDSSSGRPDGGGFWFWFWGG